MQTPQRIQGLQADEVCLWMLFGPGRLFERPREAAAFMGMPPRRLRYLLEKWAKKGIYESGTWLDLGWKVAQRNTLYGHTDIPLFNTNLWVKINLPNQQPVIVRNPESL